MKRLPLILLICLVFSCISLNAFAAEIGDVNSDGAINATDALAVLKHAAKIESVDATLGDVTRNNSIDATDALFILKYAAHIIPDLSEETINATPAPTPTAVPVASNISNLKNHLKTNGTADEFGGWFVGYDYGDGLSSYIAYYPEEDLLQLELVYYSESTDGEIMFTEVDFPLTGANANSLFYAEYAYGDFYQGFEASAPVNIKTLTTESTFKYTETASENVTADEKPILLESANSITSDAFIIWESTLYEELGYGLNHFGFTKYDITQLEY